MGELLTEARNIHLLMVNDQLAPTHVDGGIYRVDLETGVISDRRLAIQGWDTPCSMKDGIAYSPGKNQDPILFKFAPIDYRVNFSKVVRDGNAARIHIKGSYQSNN